MSTRFATFRQAKRWIGAGLLWANGASFAWAQAADAAAEESGKSYGAAYGLIMLCIVLALLLVLRPVGREDPTKTS